MLPRPENDTLPVAVRAEGFVYLIQSGNYHKIGHSDTLERRIKEIRVTLPEPVALVHVIRIDDPLEHRGMLA